MRCFEDDVCCVLLVVTVVVHCCCDSKRVCVCMCMCMCLYVCVYVRLQCYMRMIGRQKHQWCSGNITAFQAFALGSIPGWCIEISFLTRPHLHNRIDWKGKFFCQRSVTVQYGPSTIRHDTVRYHSTNL